ncbi:MAG TPA: hypothetical protein VGH33_05005, partial [Isosphaeraceae bacterium]
MPPPAAFGIKPPVVASGESESRKPVASSGWQSAGAAKLASRSKASNRETEAVPAGMNREDVDSPPAPPADEVG